MAPNQSKMVPYECTELPSPIILHQKPNVEFRVFKDTGSYISVLAHKSILSSSSSVFNFQCSSSTPGSIISLHITDFPPEVLCAYLKFIYADQDQLLVNLDILTLFQLFDFAGKYKVKDLQEEILLVLEEYKVCQRNFLELVKIIEDNKHLEDACKALKLSLGNFTTVNLKSVEDISKLFIDNLSSSGTVALSVSVWELFKDVVGAKKTVRFSDFVQKQTFRVNSAIVSNTAKNKKKAEKKRRAFEKRNSESDASSFDEKVLNSKAIARKDNHVELFDDSSNDSGLASSFEESINLNFDGENLCEMLMEEGEDNNPFKMCNEYIFNMDF